MKTDTDTTTTVLYTIGAAALFLVMGLLVWVMYAYTRPDPVGQPRAEARLESLQELHEANQAELGTYGWADEDKGVVRLPIQQAMQILLREWENPEQGRAALLSRIPAEPEYK